MIRLTSLIAIAACLAAPAVAECPSQATTASVKTATLAGHPAASLNIVETAAEAGMFKTLLAAAIAAGLADALQGEGPMTVFAPTDAAFADLPEGTVDTLLKPENKGQLVGILKLHVIDGAAIMSAQLAGKSIQAETLNGMVDIDGTDGVTVNGASVIKADIEASNGVIHVIDKVLLPAA